MVLFMRFLVKNNDCFQTEEIMCEKIVDYSLIVLRDVDGLSVCTSGLTNKTETICSNLDPYTVYRVSVTARNDGLLRSQNQISYRTQELSEFHPTNKAPLRCKINNIITFFFQVLSSF